MVRKSGVCNEMLSSRLPGCRKTCCSHFWSHFWKFQGGRVHSSHFSVHFSLHTKDESKMDQKREPWAPLLLRNIARQDSQTVSWMTQRAVLCNARRLGLQFAPQISKSLSGHLVDIPFFFIFFRKNSRYVFLWRLNVDKSFVGNCRYYVSDTFQPHWQEHGLHNNIAQFDMRDIDCVHMWVVTWLFI